ncbi:MAG: NfeD family protein [Limnochordia bacterium]|jgi:membrane-bound serine protease (ClpP class)
MRGHWLKIILLSLLLISALVGQAAGSERVLVIPIRGDIETGLAEFVQRSLRTAQREGVQAVIMEIDTFGGRVDAATEIADMIIEFPIPIIAHVRGRAWSAGALIAIATDTLIMSPGSSIGAAEPRPAEEKTVSALRAEFESMAERNQRDPLIAAAMVDRDLVIEGLVAQDKILTLSAQEAARRGFADLILTSRQEVLAELGLTGAEIIEMEPNWAERMARFFTTPTVSSLLLTIGFLGLIAEVTTPGWGIPGTVGITALSVFFGGRYLVGLAGVGSIFLFIVGLVLLLVEIFLIPGFGFVGIGGLVAIFYSIYSSFPTPQAALGVMAVTLVSTIFFGYLLIRYAGRIGAWDRLVLSTSATKEEGYVAPPSMAHYAGKEGQTLTPLRPSGVIEIEGERLDALSEGRYIPAQSPIVVIRVEGSKIIVKVKEDQ